MNIAWKYWFAHNGAKIHLKIVKSLLIKDLKSVFDLVLPFERIWLSKWRPTKALFSDFFSAFEVLISLLVSFSKYGALYENWFLIKVVLIDKVMLTNTGGQKDIWDLIFQIWQKFETFWRLSWRQSYVSSPEIKTNQLRIFILAESCKKLREIGEELNLK